MALPHDLKDLHRLTLLYADIPGLKSLPLGFGALLIGLCVLVLGPLLPLPPLLLILGMVYAGYIFVSPALSRPIEDLYARRWGVVRPIPGPLTVRIGIGCGLTFLLPWLCFVLDSTVKLPISLTYLAFAFNVPLSGLVRKIASRERTRPLWYQGISVLFFVCMALAPLAGLSALVPPSAGFWFVLAGSEIVQALVGHLYLVTQFSRMKGTSYDSPA